MPSLFSLTSTQLGGFLLVLTRASGIFFLTPVIGSRNVPVQIKIWLSLFLAIIAFPFVKMPQSVHLDNPMLFSITLGRELMVGVIIGFVALMFFSAVLIAGQLIDMQMGFGLVNVIDPMSQNQVPVIGQLKYLIAILVFLAINGHHWFVMMLAKSFELIPLGTFSLTPVIAEVVVRSFSDVLVMALKIGAPIFGTLILVDIALGIVARTMPQINVFIVGFPLKIGVGLATFILVLPYMSTFLLKLFDAMQNTIFNLIVLGGG